MACIPITPSKSLSPALLKVKHALYDLTPEEIAIVEGTVAQQSLAIAGGGE